MQYYVQTDVVQIANGSRNSRTVVYNFRLQRWQQKLTKPCLTSNRAECERIHSTRVLSQRNTYIYSILD